MLGHRSGRLGFWMSVSPYDKMFSTMAMAETPGWFTLRKLWASSARTRPLWGYSRSKTILWPVGSGSVPPRLLVKLGTGWGCDYAVSHCHGPQAEPLVDIAYGQASNGVEPMAFAQTKADIPDRLVATPPACPIRCSSTGECWANSVEVNLPTGTRRR